MTQQITRQDMVSWMETDGCARVTERPRLNWSRVDAFVADQHTGTIDGVPTGFHLFETALAGQQRVRYDTKMEPGLGTTFDLRPGIVQCATSNTFAEVEMEGDITFLQILIDDSIFRDAWAAMYPGDEANFETWTFIGAHDENMRRIATALLDEARIPSPGGELYAEALAQQLAILILRRQHGAARRNVSPCGLSDREFAIIIDHVHANLDDPGGAKTLAQLLDMNPYAFIRAFKNRTGLPPHRYVSELRIDAVKQRLAHSDDSLADIAYATGFSSQSHMTNAFGRHTGVAPGAYRRLVTA